MAIDIDWAGTAVNPYRILVPRADMPIVQSSPEIRELDVDVFRKELRSLEAAQAGAPWPETHDHVTQFTLAGFTYARLVKILTPYTVEFEDGQYAVRAVGANHNILDVKVANQVSFASQNSAGLVVTDSGAGDWTSTEKDQIRGALGIGGTQSAPAGGGHLQDTKAAAEDAKTASESADVKASTLLIDVDDVQERVIWIRKCLRNRLEIDFVTQQLLLYDDDGVIVLQRWAVSTDGGESVQTRLGVQTRRGVPQP